MMSSFITPSSFTSKGGVSKCANLHSVLTHTVNQCFFTFIPCYSSSSPFSHRPSILSILLPDVNHLKVGCLFLGFVFQRRNGKNGWKSQKEGIKYRGNGGMLPEEMMKPKNECQSKKQGDARQIIRSRWKEWNYVEVSQRVKGLETRE